MFRCLLFWWIGMNRFRTESVREQLAMKARAREILQKLIDYFAFTGSIGEHFKGETVLEVKGKHSAQEISARANQQLENMSQTLSWPLLPQLEEARPLALLGHRVLRVLAEGKIVPQEDLDALTAIMDGFILKTPISWDERSRTY